MHSFSIVVFQIFLECTIDFPHICRNFVQTFLLKGTIESFDMSVVVGFTESSESVVFLDPLDEPS